MAFSFTSLFGGLGSGGIEHSGGGKTTPLPAADPQSQLSTGQPTTAPAVAPANTPEPDPLNSHLEDMAAVWKTATTADGKPVAPTADPLSQPLFNFKKDDVIASAKKLDFTSNINPELAAKALAGDASALQQYVNETVQTAFAAMTLNAGNLMNEGFVAHGRAFDQALPNRLRNHEVQNRVSEDPVLSHPAVAPIIQAMKATIAQQQPSMRPEDVQRAAENYVKGLGTAINLNETKAVAKKQDAAAPDWMAWAGLER